MPNQTVEYFLKMITGSRRLTPKEEDVLVRRLKKKKLKTIGRRYKVTDERIRQIEEKALKKLRSKIFQEKLFKV